MTAADILDELKPLGSESYKRILLNHCVKEPVLGVKVEYLQKIRKRVKKDHALALGLYDTGVYDAQYLAGLIADEARMTKTDLRYWLSHANCAAVCGTSVAWVAAESPHGWELGLEWIDSKKEAAAQAGWVTLSMLVGVRGDEELDLAELKRLLKRVEETIHASPNLVRYAMNGFVIALGTYVEGLSAAAVKAGEKIGAVSVDMGNTECKVPFAPDYIRKARGRGPIKKRATARC